MIRKTRRLLPLLAAVLGACQDQLPTAVGPALAPVRPLTFEVILPWSEFVSDARVLGGFGRPVQTGSGLVAHEFGGEVEAHTLVRMAEFPRAANVVDSLGTTRKDTLLTFLDATLFVTFDTTSNSSTGSVTLQLERILEPWDARTAGWELAVDSVGERTPWGEPGGGPVEPIAGTTWFPQTGLDGQFFLNAATLALLGDTTRNDRGLRIRLATPGHRLDITGVRLDLRTSPSINQDNTVLLSVGLSELTYVYTPTPPAPEPDELRAGGVPAWRSVLTLGLPASVPGNPAVCARLSCPVPLTAGRLNHAGLLLTTEPTEPAFVPTDPIQFEVRGVLAPEFLPKSPLGAPLFLDTLGLAVGTTVPESAFHPGGARVVEIPITPIVRSLLSGSTLSGFRPTPTIALMELFEPISFTFGSFVGPGRSGEPRLRLVLTVSDQVALP